jgi:hypothetical protein
MVVVNRARSCSFAVEVDRYYYYYVLYPKLFKNMDKTCFLRETPARPMELLHYHTITTHYNITIIFDCNYGVGPTKGDDFSIKMQYLVPIHNVYRHLMLRLLRWRVVFRNSERPNVQHRGQILPCGGPCFPLWYCTCTSPFGYAVRISSSNNRGYC